jgi:hypothetical protein
MMSSTTAAEEKSMPDTASAWTVSPLPREPGTSIRVRVWPPSERAAAVTASPACSILVAIGKRAVTASQIWLGSVNGRAVHEGRTWPNMLTGTNTDGKTPRMSPEKSLGATPMMVKTWPFNRRVRPTTS